MNALVDGDIIQALYRASQAGVKIDLLVRGICCLRPQVPGVSENITVRSIVDRFLEHSRIFYFENAGRPEYWVGSADWMPRNFFRRIEAVFPIEDPRLRRRVKNELLGIPLADNVKSWQLQSDGQYKPVKRRKFRSQEEFIKRARGGRGKITIPVSATYFPPPGEQNFEASPRRRRSGRRFFQSPPASGRLPPRLSAAGRRDWRRPGCTFSIAALSFVMMLFELPNARAQTATRRRRCAPRFHLVRFVDAAPPAARGGNGQVTLLGPFAANAQRQLARVARDFQAQTPGVRPASGTFPSQKDRSKSRQHGQSGSKPGINSPFLGFAGGPAVAAWREPAGPCGLDRRLHSRAPWSGTLSGGRQFQRGGGGLDFAAAGGQPPVVDIENEAKPVADGVAQRRAAVFDARELVAGNPQFGGEGRLGPVDLIPETFDALADFDFARRLQAAFL